MEFLEKLADWFGALFGSIQRIFLRFFGSSNERRVRAIGFAREQDGTTNVVPGSVLDRINSMEDDWQKLSDDELRQSSARFRERLEKGETLDELLPEAFAAVRESGRRYLKMRHYDVQMVGGYFLHHGNIAEMVTGEGKTLVSTLPSYLNALAGKVHAITVNDYLAQRDMEWMGPLHIGLGLTVGAIQANMSPRERQHHYACDITYGTNNEFGFDYLRDNMKPSAELQVQGPLDFAIIDEVDNILIDEARTPLIISGPAHDDITKYPKADRIARQLKIDVDFEVKEKEHTCHMTEDGVRRGEELAGVDSFYTAGNMEWPHLIDNALKAHYLYKRDVNYVVENGNVVIVDEFTGRKMEGRQWSDGLHQAVEAKEGVKIKEESQTLATITLQNYFKLYGKLAGMTGTAMTEADEFFKIYKLDVVAIPTNRPLARINHPDVILRTEREKWNAVVGEVRDVHSEGRPVLVGTTSIEQSEMISNRLKKFGIQHNVLNAKFHEREAEIIAQAGRKGAVTIATNMAGRGTDIILGGNPEHLAWEDLRREYASRLDIPKSVWDEKTNRISQQEGMDTEGREVADLGGLHVIGTERHDSRRIDLQLRGRAGRQGDPGSSRFFLSLEDKLMRLFAGEWVRNFLGRIGMSDGETIESGLVTRRVEAAQKKIEERHFDQRKNLLEYDEVMDEQRKSVYSFRQRILHGENCRELILEMIDRQISHWTEQFLSVDYRWNSFIAWASQSLQLELSIGEVRNSDAEQLRELLCDEFRRQAEDRVLEQFDVSLPLDAESEREWNWIALSRWANTNFGLNTNDRELKNLGREEAMSTLCSRASDAVKNLDLSAVEHFANADFGLQTLHEWLVHHFTIEIPIEELRHDDINQTITEISSRVRAMYREKEIRFPVAVGINNFLSKEGGTSDRGGLINWANSRFDGALNEDMLRNRERNDIEEILVDCSRKFFVELDVREKVESLIPSDTEQHPVPIRDENAIAELAGWSRDALGSEDTAEDLHLDSTQAIVNRLLESYDQRFRPEMRQAERALILEVLDQSWKDHLYHMDHVRSGIGLVGYAQKDPKVEYKREGKQAFDSMWTRIDEQVTGAIFRIEKESPAFVGSLWEITATTHAEASSTDSAPPETGGGAPLEPGQQAAAVEPIKNFDPKVGRNDPCPCGSGKKFKKCHGA